MMKIISSRLLAHNERSHRWDISLVPALLVQLTVELSVVRAGLVFASSNYGFSTDAAAWILSGLLGSILIACALLCISVWNLAVAADLMLLTLLNPTKTKNLRSAAALLLPPIAATLAYFLCSSLPELLFNFMGPQCEFHRSFVEEDFVAGYLACKTLWTERRVAFWGKPHLIKCCAVSPPAVIALHAQVLITTLTWTSAIVPWRNWFVAAIENCVMFELFLLDEVSQLGFRIVQVVTSAILMRLRKRRRSKVAVQIAASKVVEDVAACIWQFVETDLLVQLLPYDTPAAGTIAWQLAFLRVLRSRSPLRVRVGYAEDSGIPGAYVCEVLVSGHKIASFKDPRAFELSPLFALVSELDMRIPRTTHTSCIDWQQFNALLRLPALRSLTLAVPDTRPLNPVQQLLLSAGGSITASSLLLDSDELSCKLEPLLPRLTSFELRDDHGHDENAVDLDEMRIATSVRRMVDLHTLKICFERFDLIFPADRLCAASVRTLANLRVLQLLERGSCGHNHPTAAGIALIAQHCPLLTELSINLDSPYPGTEQPSTTAYFNAFRSLSGLQNLHLFILRGHELVLRSNEAPVTSVRSLRIEAKGFHLPGHTLTALVATFNNVVFLDVEVSYYAPCIPYLSSIARGEVCADVRDLALRRSYSDSLRAARFSSPDRLAPLIQSFECSGTLNLVDATSPIFFENVHSVHHLIELMQSSRVRFLVIPGALKASELEQCMAIPNLRFSWKEATPQRRRSTSPKTHEAWFRSFDAVTNFKLTGTKTSGASAGRPRPFSVLVCGSSKYVPPTEDFAT